VDSTLWFVDFDDTLVVGPVTWALNHVFPRMIRDNKLPFDQRKFNEAILTAQQHSNEEMGEMAVVDGLFQTMGWPDTLKKPLNNNYAPHIAEQLGIARHFAGIFTPKSCGGVRGKPQREMWDHLLAQRIVADHPADMTGMVGDDPWSDGTFSERCNIPCWIVDRMDRFARLRADKPYRWAASLAEIGLGQS
jgi:FMN phosphatase YigB (HAD superfamily)